MGSLFSTPKMPAVAAATKMPDAEDKVAQDDMRMREAKRRKEKGRTSTDWRKVAQMYRSLLDVEPDRLDEMEQRHTSVGEPSTRFAVTYEKEEDA